MDGRLDLDEKIWLQSAHHASAARRLEDGGWCCRWRCRWRRHLQIDLCSRWRRWFLLWMSLWTDSDRLSCLKTMVLLGLKHGQRWSVPIEYMMAYSAYVWFIGHWLLYFLCLCAKEQHIYVCLDPFFILIMIGKMTWLGIVWLYHPFAMVPYCMRVSFHQAPGHSYAEGGYERIRNLGQLICVIELWGRIWWLTPYGLDHETQQSIDGANRSRWWTDRCRLSYPSPPPPVFL